MKPVDLPEGCAAYTDKKDQVLCAKCYKPMIFGHGYVSLEITTEFGLGFTICPSCYTKEMRELEQRYRGAK